MESWVARVTLAPLHTVPLRTGAPKTIMSGGNLLGSEGNEITTTRKRRPETVRRTKRKRWVPPTNASQELIKFYLKKILVKSKKDVVEGDHYVMVFNCYLNFLTTMVLAMVL